MPLDSFREEKGLYLVDGMTDTIEQIANAEGTETRYVKIPHRTDSQPDHNPTGGQTMVQWRPVVWFFQSAEAITKFYYSIEQARAT